MPEPRDYPAEKARQGEVVLRSRARRLVFATGFVALIVLAVVLRIALQT